MNVVSLITKLAEQDIRLWLEQGNLRYSAPDGAMTPVLIAEVRTAKTAIIEFLQQAESRDQIELPLANRKEPMVVSAAQQRLWFLHQLDSKNSAYHIHAALRIKGNLHVNLLSKACTEIIARHEILRTHYIQQSGKIFQVVDEPLNWEITVEALAENLLPKVIAEEIHTPFDLQEGSVLRTRLWQIETQEYVMAFTIHHIASDGWSLGILVNELVLLYEAYVKHQAASLPPLIRQYADFSLWQSENEKGLDEQRQYWQRQLQGVQNLSLPFDSPPSIYKGSEGSYVEIHLSEIVADKLKVLNKAQGTTLFMSLMAAFSALLYRYTQQNDFCIGTPIAGRTVSQLEPMMGCFLNVLAIRCEPDGQHSFLQHLSNIKKTCTEAFAHQDLAFEQIVHEFVKERDLAVSPLFQVMLSVQNTPFIPTADLSELKITPYDGVEPAAQFDLKLTAQEVGAEIVLRFEYKKALFHKTTIVRLAEHFVALMNEVVDKPNTPLFAINLFGSANTQEILGIQTGGLNDTTALLPKDLLLHYLFEEQVEKTPNAVAIADENTTFTYEQLNCHANQLAHQLISMGEKPNLLIGVCLQRSVNMSVALLAVLKTGCAYVPFDPELPIDRLKFMAQDTCISTLITDRNSAEIASQVSGCCLIIEDIDNSLLSIKNPNIVLPNDGLFNVIYTSGSTGNPKGVMVTHEGIANRLLWMQKKYRLTSKDTILQKTPFSFDVSVWELFWPLIVGAKYHFAKPDGHKDPSYLRDLIIDKKISTLHFVPSMLSSFIQTTNISQCSSIRQVFCSGEALQLEHENLFFKQLPYAALENLYGPTEASIDVSFYSCKVPNPFSSVPIGRAIDNIQLHILDEHLQVVPVGIAGELHIGGIGLAKGYWNREQLTEKCFIANPFKQQNHPSARLYKTGDLAKLSEQGEILYLGRIDHQVKLRGYRIELGEIESALLKHKDIAEVVVVAYKQSNNDSRLVAYYQSNEALVAQTLTAHLATFLPQYMIPAHFIQLAEWPLTPSGKINRNKLPVPDWNVIDRRPYVEPITDTQKTLAGIWQDVLGLEKVGLHDSFFELGGHSLTATQAIAKAQETFAVEIPLRQIFENPFLEAISALIDQAVLEQAIFKNNNEVADDEESFIL